MAFWAFLDPPNYPPQLPQITTVRGHKGSIKVHLRVLVNLEVRGLLKVSFEGVYRGSIVGFYLITGLHIIIVWEVRVLGFRIWGLGFRVWGLGFRVSVFVVSFRV